MQSDRKEQWPTTENQMYFHSLGISHFASSNLLLSTVQTSSKLKRFKDKNKAECLDSNFARRRPESKRTHNVYPRIVHLTHSIQLYRQMMRINRKTTGTIAMWFVNLSNQWKRRNRKLLWCLCFAFPKEGTVLYAKQYISLEPSYSIQAGAQRFPNSRLLPHLLFDKKGLFRLLWNLYYNATSPSALGGQLLTMQVMTSHNILQSFFVLALPLPAENNTLKERKQGKKKVCNDTVRRSCSLHTKQSVSRDTTWVNMQSNAS